MLKYLQKPNSAALAFLVSGAVWFVVGTLYGIVSAIDLMAPEFFDNIGWLNFGRTRPIHVNTMLFGFLTTTLIGGGLYYTPALLRTRLWSEPLAWFALLMWNITVLSGPLTFSFGMSQGREYTEYLWTFDVTAMIAFSALLCEVVMTIADRKENILYVSVWYFLGTFLWMAGTYPVGNVMWRPATGAMPGLLDSILLWFYGHNLPGLLLTPLAVGAAYYVIPRVAKTPLYSHVLSLIGFWTLLSLYAHIGGHHILQAPIPNWLKAFSIIDSVLMVIPVFAVLANIWLTARGRSGAVLRDPAGRWVLGGTIWYLITCIQGPIQSLPAVQRVTHFNNWVVAHAHIAVLGFAGFIAIGAMWHVLPLITHRRLYSDRLVHLQFGLITIGLAGFFTVLSIAGLIQGSAWYNGQVVYKVLPQIGVYMSLRAMFGIFLIAGGLIGLYNVIMTIRHGEPFEVSPLEEEEAA